MMKKITLLLAMLALMMFAAVPAAFAYELELDEDGYITVTDADAELVYFVKEDTALFDELCSPLNDINLVGCVFSEEDEEVYYLVSDDFEDFVYEIVLEE
jgi:hypothetical protein